MLLLYHYHWCSNWIAIALAGSSNLSYISIPTAQYQQKCDTTPHGLIVSKISKYLCPSVSEKLKKKKNMEYRKTYNITFTLGNGFVKKKGDSIKETANRKRKIVLKIEMHTRNLKSMLSGV